MSHAKSKSGEDGAEILLGHRFSQPKLLTEALTHRSAAGARGKGSNERLEFIGDRVLGLIIAEWLIERFPQEREGALGPRLAALVSRPALAAIAEANGLAALLAVAPGESRRGVRERSTVLADALEAIIGALYLDAGLSAARDFIRRVFAGVVDQQFVPPKDPKTALQEWALKRALPLPAYEVLQQSGPSHAPLFIIQAKVGDATGKGEAGSKRAAEQLAASLLLGNFAAMSTNVDNATRCGFVAIIGAPNAGKSTLLNRLTGAKISIVTPKAQTTRARVLGILMHNNSQVLLVDTPGIFSPKRRLDRAMVAAAWGGADEADYALLIVDAKAGLTRSVAEIAEKLAGSGRKLSLVLNKTDLVDRQKLLPLAGDMSKLADFEQIFMVSATTGDGIEALLDFCAASVPAGPYLYPEDNLTDLTDRLVSSEVVREQIFLQTRDEVPYGTTVETEQFVEQKDGSVRIEAIIYVSRSGHKKILIGAGGARIREIGARARLELTGLLECKVHLFLRVKERPGWDEEAARIRATGLNDPSS